MKNKKGFTLIELLAVIVILGLLMAIAIPSVTKYITESRKKTVTTTIGNYIGALVNEVNDLQYTFTDDNTIYAVPIECIALERGGTNPFGEWHQANDAYWAYVLVQYDDDNSKYVYGYTFKDSAGYGLYPTSQEKLQQSGSQVKTGLDLTKPETGTITTLTSLDNWNNSGFKLDATTNLQVLEAGSEGEIGDGKTICTLCQKGNNYAQVEKAKEEKKNIILQGLAKLVISHNTIKTTTPTLTTSSNNTSDESGLYVSTMTNNGNPTYYFRGSVKNNNVSFAGVNWKIVRINEDGTVRLVLDGRIDNNSYKFSSSYYSYGDMYYSNSDIAKTEVDSWYENNINGKGYDSYVSNGVFCEEAKTKYSSNYTSGSATMTIYTSYKPNFKCATDGNGYGIINTKAGLITYDEAIYAGAYFNTSNSNYYLYNGYGLWTMSPSGFTSASASEWYVNETGRVYNSVFSFYSLSPVINLNANVEATGTGTSDDPYVIVTE